MEIQVMLNSQNKFEKDDKKLTLSDFKHHYKVKLIKIVVLA